MTAARSTAIISISPALSEDLSIIKEKWSAPTWVNTTTIIVIAKFIIENENPIKSIAGGEKKGKGLGLERVGEGC
jgi:hypothetical protein